MYLIIISGFVGMRGKKSMDHEDAVNELFAAQNGADAERYLKRAGMYVRSLIRIWCISPFFVHNNWILKKYNFHIFDMSYYFQDLLVWEAKKDKGTWENLSYRMFYSVMSELDLLEWEAKKQTLQRQNFNVCLTTMAIFDA